MKKCTKTTSVVFPVLLCQSCAVQVSCIWWVCVFYGFSGHSKQILKRSHLIFSFLSSRCLTVFEFATQPYNTSFSDFEKTARLRPSEPPYSLVRSEKPIKCIRLQLLTLQHSSLNDCNADVQPGWAFHVQYKNACVVDKACVLFLYSLFPW